MVDTEFTGRYKDSWVSRRFVMPLRHIKKESLLTINGRRHMYPETLTLHIYVNGELVHEEMNPIGSFSITVSVPPMHKGKLEIVASDVFVPNQVGLNEDVRQLAFLLDEVIIPGIPDVMELYHSLFDFTPSKQVYFIEDELWDTLRFLLHDSYKVPDKELLLPVSQHEWWENIKPATSSYLRGTVYNKFTGHPLQQAEVKLCNEHNEVVMETVVDDQGCYEFQNLAYGHYEVRGHASEFGEQPVRVEMSQHGKTINIPMLPLA